MSFRYDKLEKEIIDRLRPVFNPKIQIVQTPQSEKDFDLPFLNGRITVVYAQSGYGESTSTAQIRQLETLQFEVIIQSKLLRGVDGLHDINERTRRRLTGWMPTSCGRVWMQKNGFVERDAQNNVFTYTLTIATTYLFIQEFENEGGEPFREAQFNIEEV